MGSGGCSKCADCADKHPILGRIPIVGKVFRNDTGSTGRIISQHESYDPEKAQLEQTIRIQQELTEFRMKCEKESDDLEKGALGEARKSLDEMIVFLKNINSKIYAGQKLNIDLERLRRNNRQTEDIINGYIKKRIQKRVSLDDDKCLEILKMDKGSQKEKKMTEFLNEVLKEAMYGLSGEIKKSMQQQFDNIEDQISNRIESYTELANEKIANFKELEKIKSSDEHNLEEKIAGLEYKHSLSVLALNMLNMEV